MSAPVLAFTHRNPSRLPDVPLDPLLLAHLLWLQRFYPRALESVTRTAEAIVKTFADDDHEYLHDTPGSVEALRRLEADAKRRRR